MNADTVQSVTRATARLRLQSLELTNDAETVRGASQKLRAEHHGLVLWVHDLRTQHAHSRLRRLIYKRLVTGLLPYDSAARLFGGPGVGGICGACDNPLLPSQLVMAIPTGAGRFVDLHADCFILWDELRWLPIGGVA